MTPLRALAEVLGHRFEVKVERPTRSFRNGQYVLTCACGYTAAPRQSMLLAIQAGRHHLLKVRDEVERNGVSLPKTVGPEAQTS